MSLLPPDVGLVSERQHSSNRVEAEQRAASYGFCLIDMLGDEACMFRAMCVSNIGTESETSSALGVTT